MALDVDSVVAEYKEMKQFLLEGKRIFTPCLLSALPGTAKQEIEIDGMMVNNTHPEFKLAVLTRLCNLHWGELRQFGGVWRLAWGAFNPPSWAKRMKPEELTALERRTHPPDMPTWKFQPCIYSEQDLEAQVRQGLRPDPTTVVGGFWAPRDDVRHWSRQTQTWSLPALFHVYGNSWTMRELYGILKSPKRGAGPTMKEHLGNLKKTRRGSLPGCQQPGSPAELLGMAPVLPWARQVHGHEGIFDQHPPGCLGDPSCHHFGCQGAHDHACHLRWKNQPPHGGLQGLPRGLFQDCCGDPHWGYDGREGGMALQYLPILALWGFPCGGRANLQQAGLQSPGHHSNGVEPIWRLRESSFLGREELTALTLPQELVLGASTQKSPSPSQFTTRSRHWARTIWRRTTVVVVVMRSGAKWSAASSWVVSAPGRWSRKKREWPGEVMYASGAEASGRGRWAAQGSSRSPLAGLCSNWSFISPRSACTTVGWRTALSSTRGWSQLHLFEMCPWRWTPTQFTDCASVSQMAWGTWAMPFGRGCWRIQRKQAWRASRISTFKDESFPDPSSFCFSKCPIARWQLLRWGPWTWAQSHQSVGTYGLVMDSTRDRPLGTVTGKVWGRLTEVLCMQTFTFFLLFVLGMFSFLSCNHLPCCALKSFSHDERCLTWYLLRACFTLWHVSLLGLMIVGGGDR